MSSVLTIDLGTTAFKFCLFGRDGRLQAHHSLAPPIVRPDDARWELSAQGFTATVEAGVQAVLQAVPERVRAAVAAVTFATQTNSFILLDDGNRALTPFILWPDTRAALLPGLETRLAALAGRASRTGVPALSAEFMAAKLAWYEAREPELWRRVRRIALISDYLTWWLTGEWACEGGAAGLTGLCDIRRLTWMTGACQAFQVDPRWLAPLVRAGVPVGGVLRERVAGLGLPADCRFVTGCLDQYAGAIGVGNVAPAGCSETTGTVLAVVRCADRLAAVRPGVFQGPAWQPDRLFQMSFSSASGNLLEAYRNSLEDRPSFEDLVAQAGRVAPGAGGLRLEASGLVGDLAGAFVGATRRHGRGHYVRCILEHVAAALERQVRELCGEAPPALIRCAGGGARSPAWLQIKADLSGWPMAVTECVEPTSLGAAMLAASALGWGDVEGLARRWVRLSATLTPNPAAHAAYRGGLTPG